jgi:hypothetical protein
MVAVDRMSFMRVDEFRGHPPKGVMGKREPQTIDDRSIHLDMARRQIHREISRLWRN